MKPTLFDIAIVGGGPVGAFLAHSLADSAFSIALLEAEAAPGQTDPRMLAISEGSRQQLARLGVWKPQLETAPIKQVKVSQAGYFGRTRLTAAEMGLAQMGFVVPYAELQPQLTQHLPDSIRQYVQTRVEHIDMQPEQATLSASDGRKNHTIQARLVVLADGGQLATELGIPYQEHDYQQTALLAQIQAKQAPTATAFERFVGDSALALLPRPQGYSLIWSLPADQAETLAQLDDDDFLCALQTAVGDKAGLFRAASPRLRWPLRRRIAKVLSVHRTVLVGNAAQSLHPIAGQGLNLGFRDAHELASILIQQGGDPGATAGLETYVAQRSRDKLNGVGFTHGLLSLFGQTGLGPARGLGLAVLDAMPTVKRRLLKHLAFGVRSA